MNINLKYNYLWHQRWLCPPGFQWGTIMCSKYPQGWIPSFLTYFWLSSWNFLGIFLGVNQCRPWSKDDPCHIWHDILSILMSNPLLNLPFLKHPVLYVPNRKPSTSSRSLLLDPQFCYHVSTVCTPYLYPVFKPYLYPFKISKHFKQLLN